jgi:hypothetical protein
MYCAACGSLKRVTAVSFLYSSPCGANLEEDYHVSGACRLSRADWTIRYADSNSLEDQVDAFLVVKIAKHAQDVAVPAQQQWKG